MNTYKRHRSSADTITYAVLVGKPEKVLNNSYARFRDWFKAGTPLQFPARHEGCNASGGDWLFSRQGLRCLTPANEEKQPLVAI
jgi:hypothetical protein